MIAEHKFAYLSLVIFGMPIAFFGLLYWVSFIMLAPLLFPILASETHGMIGFMTTLILYNGIGCLGIYLVVIITSFDDRVKNKRHKIFFVGSWMWGSILWGGVIVALALEDQGYSLRGSLRGWIL